MPRQPVLIRSLTDFVNLPDNELVRCLDAFRLAIIREKLRRETLSHAPAAGDASFTEFVWCPKSDEDPWDDTYARETPLQEMPVRYDAVDHLKALNIYCLEDLSEISASELRVIPGMGLTTVTRLDEALRRIGLAFRPNPNPEAAMYERSRALQKQNRSSDENPIRPVSHVAELGLLGQTLRQLVRKGYVTVGGLQKLTLTDYSRMFGRKTALQIITRLADSGAAIEDDCSPLALWQHGLLTPADLPNSLTVEDPIGHAAPWLGRTITNMLLANGLTTVGQVAQAVVDGRLERQVKLTARAKQKTIDFLRERKLLTN